MNFLVYIFLFSTLSISSAHAYLDPGSGGSILQIIIAFIAAIGATLSFYWSKFKLFISRLLKKKNKEDSTN
ncbi:hypothetical protein OA187_02080 [Candidatus Pelagibacter sp.]|nr:hypothetical protein [Candidatus Pelagibacter sp.]